MLRWILILLRVINTDIFPPNLPTKLLSFSYTLTTTLVYIYVVDK
ncbi:hypothetical protein HanIR_Chr16g0789361 [Helianthus annuus]|nr:hypothetical protein HanIR_Chr16g0789361 [Helianthus annuus]